MLVKKYHPYLPDGSHGMETIDYKNVFDALSGRNGVQVDHVMIKASDAPGVLSEPLNSIGYQHVFDRDGYIVFDIYDKDGNLSGAKLGVDNNPAAAFAEKTLTYNAKTGDMEGFIGGNKVVADLIKIDATHWTLRIDHDLMEQVVGRDFDGGKFGAEFYNDGISSYNEWTYEPDPIGLVA